MRSRGLGGCGAAVGNPGHQRATLIIFDSPAPDSASRPQPSAAPSRVPGTVPPREPWSSPVRMGTPPPRAVLWGPQWGGQCVPSHWGMPTLPNQRESQSCFIVMWSGRASLLNRICTYAREAASQGAHDPTQHCDPQRPDSRAAAAAPGGGTGPSAGAGSAPAQSISRTSAARAEWVRAAGAPAPRDQCPCVARPQLPSAQPGSPRTKPSPGEGCGARSGQSPGAGGLEQQQGGRRDPRSPAARPCSCPCWSCGEKGQQGGGCGLYALGAPPPAGAQAALGWVPLPAPALPPPARQAHGAGDG